MCKCKRRPLGDEHVDYLFNCRFFTAEVKGRHDVIVHNILLYHFLFTKHGNLQTPTGTVGRTPDGLLRGLKINPRHLDVKILYRR